MAFDFATKHCIHSFPEEKEEAQEGKMNSCGSGGLTPTTYQTHGNVFEHQPFYVPPSLEFVGISTTDGSLSIFCFDSNVRYFCQKLLFHNPFYSCSIERVQ